MSLTSQERSCVTLNTLRLNNSRRDLYYRQAGLLQPLMIIMKKWKDIPGYEGLYRVSSTGEILRIKTNELKAIRPHHKNEYRLVDLSKNGSKKTHLVHRLVMLAFEGECPEGMEVCHIDENKGNNNLSNLVYDTHANNQQHSIKRGTFAIGTSKSNSKLDEPSVRVIRLLREFKMTHQEIADIFKVSRTLIIKVVQGKCWRHA